MGGVEKDDGSTCTGTVAGTVAGSGAGSADSGAGFGENWSSGCTGSSGKSGGSGSSGAGGSSCGTCDSSEAIIDFSDGVIEGSGVTSEIGIVCCEGGIFAQTGVGGDGGDEGDDKEDRGSLQKGGERGKVVSLSSSLNR